MKSPLLWPPPKNWNRLWPALKGSLAKIYKPCIRPHCPQCAQGTKHPAFILSFTQKGKRRCMYVPEELVPLLQKALDNGRSLEDLLYAQGPLLLQQYRQQRDQKSLPKTKKILRQAKLPKKIR